MAKKKLLQKMTYQKGSILEKEKLTSLMNLETHNSEIELVETAAYDDGSEYITVRINLNPIKK